MASASQLARDYQHPVVTREWLQRQHGDQPSPDPQRPDPASAEENAGTMRHAARAIT
jgi:hypothetical protein